MGFFKKTILFLTRLLYPCKQYGMDNITDGNAVIIFNHLSFIDPLYVVRTCKKEDINTLAKKEIFKHKIFGKILKMFGAIPLDRENPDITTLYASIKTLKNGKKLALAPEGTRNKTGSTNFLPFKSGACLFAIKSKSPIIPIVIYKKARLFRRNYLLVGKPFTLEQFYDKKLTEVDYDNATKILFNEMTNLQNELFNMVNKK